MRGELKESAHPRWHDGVYRVVNNAWLAQVAGRVMPALKSGLKDFNGAEAEFHSSVFGVHLFREAVPVKMFAEQRCLNDRNGNEWCTVTVHVGGRGDYRMVKWHKICIFRKRVWPDDWLGVEMAPRGTIQGWTTGPDNLTEKKFLSWLKVKLCRVYGETTAAGCFEGAETSSERVQRLQEALDAAIRVNNATSKANDELRRQLDDKKALDHAAMNARQEMLDFLIDRYGAASDVASFIRDNTIPGGPFNVDVFGLGMWLADNIPCMKEQKMDARMEWVFKELFTFMEKMYRMGSKGNAVAIKAKRRRLSMGAENIT